MSLAFPRPRGEPPGASAGPAAALQRFGAAIARRWALADLAAAACLVACAALVRWPALWTIPIFTDEGDEALVALRIVRDHALPLTNDDPYIGPVFNYLLAALLWVLGPSPWLPRLLVLGVGSLTVGASYLLARELAGNVKRGRWAGLAAALLVAVNAEQVVVNSHVAWSNCITPLFTTLGCWLLVRRPHPQPPLPNLGEGAAKKCASRNKCASRGVGSPSGLVLAGLAFGLALQTHPSVLALLPGLLAFGLWRGRAWLRTAWPYAGAGAFVLAQAPTIAYNVRAGWLSSLAEAQRWQTFYNRGEQLDLATYLARLGRLVYALGAALAGLLNDRDTPPPPAWHPVLVLALILAVVGLGWAWRRGQPLPALVCTSGLLVLPLFNGQYVPLVSNARYLAPLTPLILAAVATCAVMAFGVGSAPRHGLWAGVAVLGITSLVSLTSFYADAARDGRTNARLLASLEALESSYRPGEVVAVDRATFRDWSLTEGRLQRVFTSWLELRGIRYAVVEVGSDGRLSGGLADTGGLLVLARGSVPAAERAYRLAEIASDGAPGAPASSGYSIVRAAPRTT